LSTYTWKGVWPCEVAVIKERKGHNLYKFGPWNDILGCKIHYPTNFSRPHTFKDIESIEGLMPLGFEEGLLMHLGEDLCLALTPAERKASRRFCMPCRIRMNERFSTGN
jgi:hypothetical protein